MAGLTSARLRTLTKPGTYGDGSGLYLQVRGPEQRAWLFRYKRSGKGRLMGLGPYPEIGLADAREAAAAARKLLAQGVDPLDARRAAQAEETAAQARTFRQVADAYVAAHEAAWRNAKHRQQWRNTLATLAYPKLGAMPVAAITTADVLAVLQPIWKATPETASRLRGRIEAVLSYSKALHWREGQNPAAWKDNLDHLLPQTGKLARVEHHAALPWSDMGAFMAALRGKAGIGARALEFAILTAARSGEVRGAIWGEIDLDAATWTVPGGRMKAGREHRVPLSDAALAVLREVAPLRDREAGAAALVFSGIKHGKPLSDMSLTAVLRRMEMGDLTAHGFRSSFRDWCAEATAYPREVAEAALAHVNKDKVEAAYARGDLFDKRRRLMAEWATYCSRPAAGGDVVPLRAKESGAA